jgi:hypothetical protein
MLCHIKSNKSYTVIIGNEVYQFNDGHKFYEDLVSSVKTGDFIGFKSKIDAKQGVSIWSKGNFTFSKDGSVKYLNTDICSSLLYCYIVELLEEGSNADPLIKFAENLTLNPSKNSVEQLYKFLQHKNMPITQDGHFVGYKAITSDWKDKRTKTIDNRIGQKPYMLRNMVEEDPNYHCHTGLHVGSYNYASGYANGNDRLILVKVNPKDVVSVSNDGNEKLRCCEYEVVAEFKQILSNGVYND